MIYSLQKFILRSYSRSVLNTCRPIDMANSYEEAIKTLNTLQSNAATIEKIRITHDQNRHRSIPDTIVMAERIGVTLGDIDKLSVIHVSGTKGKGSTCAFSESVLRSFGFRTGFYSSPHLVEVRERIRIDGRPLSRDDFSRYFWHCYRLLDESKVAHNDTMPPYFRFLTIMAFHVFLQEKVDVAILEVGIGGQYDCTNIVRNPVVCGVTSLGIDHTSMLGDTIDKIAWHKAGILKANVPAVTVEQPKAGMDVLKERAKEIGCPLYVAPNLESYDWKGHQMELGIPGVQQLLNASLALQLCHFWVKDHKLTTVERQNLYAGEEHGDPVANCFPISAEMAAGLHSCIWPARNQKLYGPGVTYYLDGAHTVESLQLCADWYNAETTKEANLLSGRHVARVLLFNMTGDRKSESLLRSLLSCNFDLAVFCPNIQSPSSDKSDLTNLTVSTKSQLQRCEENRNVWLQLLSEVSCDSSIRNGVLSEEPDAKKVKLSSSPDTNGGSDNNNITSEEEISPTSVAAFNTILESLAFVSRGRDTRIVKYGTEDIRLPPGVETADHVQVLCTGSLHLVGGILSLLDPTVCDSPR